MDNTELKALRKENDEWEKIYEQSLKKISNFL